MLLEKSWQILAGGPNSNPEDELRWPVRGVCGLFPSVSLPVFRVGIIRTSSASFMLSASLLPLSFLPPVGVHPCFPTVGPFERIIHFFRRFPPQPLSNLKLPASIPHFSPFE